MISLPTRQVTLEVIPLCDVCKTFPAVADAPTKHGPWAYLCTTHYRNFASQGAPALGSRLIAA